MTTTGREPGELFVNLRALEAAGASDSWPADLDEVKTWLHGFVCRPNLALGRDGAVCPCAVESVRNGDVFVVDIDLGSHVGGEKRAALTERLLILKGALSSFLSSCERPTGVALLATVHPLEPHELRYVMDGAYTDVKLTFLKDGLMVGSFHPFNNRSSANNPSFFPMRPSVPLFAFRKMTKFDWRSLQERPEYLEEFIRRFGVPEPNGK